MNDYSKSKSDQTVINIEELGRYHDLIAGIVAALEARDLYTSDHSMRVAEMTEAICGYLNLTTEETTLYHIAAHLHDIGKIGIEDAVLRKEGSLNDAEWKKMKEHPEIGHSILKKVECFQKISMIVRAHHERWDGRGYPDGLSEDEIPYGARIIAVADSVDAMMSTRPYRSGIAAEKCYAEIQNNILKMYDASIAQAALDNWDNLLQRRKQITYKLV